MKEIEIKPDVNIESTVYTLLAAKARGQRVFCNFNGHILHSNNVSIDSAYQEIVGCSKEEHEKMIEKSMEEYKERLEEKKQENIELSKTENIKK